VKLIFIEVCYSFDHLSKEYRCGKAVEELDGWEEGIQDHLQMYFNIFTRIIIQCEDVFHYKMR
jgi:hypothetical protein